MLLNIELRKLKVPESHSKLSIEIANLTFEPRREEMRQLIN